MTYPNWIPLSSLSFDEETFICEWGSCQTKPIDYIVFGCLEQHLGELVLCTQHTTVWVRTLPSMRCGCGEPIDGYKNLLVRDIHPTWLTTLLRDQNARRAGKYLAGVGVPTTVNTNVVKPSGSIAVGGGKRP